MQCSTPNCKKTAVIQWSQKMDDAAAEQHLAEVAGRLQSVSEAQRLSLRVRIAALQDAVEDPPKNLSPQDVKAFQDRGEAQIATLREEHNAIPAEFDLSRHREGMVSARGACEDHQHDLEWHARVHETDCSGALDCGCP